MSNYGSLPNSTHRLGVRVDLRDRLAPIEMSSPHSYSTSIKCLILHRLVTLHNAADTQTTDRATRIDYSIGAYQNRRRLKGTSNQSSWNLQESSQNMGLRFPMRRTYFRPDKHNKNTLTIFGELATNVCIRMVERFGKVIYVESRANRNPANDSKSVSSKLMNTTVHCVQRKSERHAYVNLIFAR